MPDVLNNEEIMCLSKDNLIQLVLALQDQLIASYSYIGSLEDNRKL